MKKISLAMLSVFFMNADVDITDINNLDIADIDNIILTKIVSDNTKVDSIIAIGNCTKLIGEYKTALDLSKFYNWAECIESNIGKIKYNLAIDREGIAIFGEEFFKLRNKVLKIEKTLSKFGDRFSWVNNLGSCGYTSNIFSFAHNVINQVIGAVTAHPYITSFVVSSIVSSYTLYKYVTNKTSKAAIAIPSAVNGVANSDVMKLSEGNQPVVAAEERKPIRIKRMVAVPHPNSIINEQINMALKNNDVSVFKKFPQSFKEVEVVEYR